MRPYMSLASKALISSSFLAMYMLPPFVHGVKQKRLSTPFTNNEKDMFRLEMYRISMKN